MDSKLQDKIDRHIWSLQSQYFETLKKKMSDNHKLKIKLDPDLEEETGDKKKKSLARIAPRRETVESITEEKKEYQEVLETLRKKEKIIDG